MANKAGRDGDLRAGTGEIPSGSTGPVAPITPFDPVSSPAGADPGPAGSPLAIFEAEQPRRRWSRVLLTTSAVLVLLAGGYVGASWALGDRVPRRTTVAGVEIGGQDAGTAAATLRARLGKLVAEPVPVAAGEKSTTIAPADAGLALDVDATVARLVGFDLQPARLWHQVVGGGGARPAPRRGHPDVGRGPEPPATAVDEAKLTAAVAAAAAVLATEPVDPGIVFTDGAPRTTAGTAGARVDPAGAAAAVRTRWLTASRPLQLPTRAVPPAVSQQQADQALAAVAEPLARGPIVVAVAAQSVELPAAVVTSLASFVPTGAELVLRLDGPRLVDELVKRTTNLLTASADASFTFVNGAPVLVPGTAGTTIDPAALAAAVAAAAVAPDRTARVDLVASDPAQSTAKLQALGVGALVSEFSTPLTNDRLRTQNLVVGAAKLTGKLVLPGETFSLSAALGPVTAAAGFNEAGVIVDGEHVKGVGGGLSQLATTTFNAAYFAGFKDVAHTPHSEWFTRYPEGREATLYTGQIDLKFKNTSPYGALLRSWIEADRLHVAIWSTPYWTVSSTTSARSAVVAPTTVRSTSATCTPQAAGNPGFTVTVTRTLALNGEVKETTKKTTRYKAQDAIICGG
jgi:vancomycin resistance protein YoaR